MRVCYFGTYDKFNPRNQLMILGLRRSGANVVECHVGLWRSTSQKVGWAKSGPFRSLLLVLRLLRNYISLVLRYIEMPSHDVLVVGYVGQVDMLLARLLASLWRKPLVFDAYQSIYETMVSDRRLVSEMSWKARIASWLDRWSCKLADVVILDTDAHIDWFCTRYSLPRDRFKKVYLGADDQVFRPLKATARQRGLTVTYFGGYVPLHGTEYIVYAAQRLAMQKDISFELVGNGQTYGQTKDLAESLGLDNVSFVETAMPGEWLSPDQLVHHISRADVCLGVFGLGQKVETVIPSKVYVALAMAKPVITGQSKAAEELLVNGQNALLCKRGDPDALADAVCELWLDRTLREGIAARGYRLFQEKLSPVATGGAFKEILKEVAMQHGADRSR